MKKTFKALLWSKMESVLLINEVLYTANMGTESAFVAIGSYIFLREYHLYFKSSKFRQILLWNCTYFQVLLPFRPTWRRGGKTSFVADTNYIVETALTSLSAFSRVVTWGILHKLLNLHLHTSRKHDHLHCKKKQNYSPLIRNILRWQRLTTHGFPRFIDKIIASVPGE